MVSPLEPITVALAAGLVVELGMEFWGALAAVERVALVAVEHLTAEWAAVDQEAREVLDQMLRQTWA